MYITSEKDTCRQNSVLIAKNKTIQELGPYRDGFWAQEVICVQLTVGMTVLHLPIITNAYLGFVGFFFLKGNG